MEGCPFSPWKSRDELDPGLQAELDNRPESLLEEVWLSIFADLYRALAPIMSPAEADECELWQLGALLGLDRPTESGSDLDRLAARVEAEKESLRERAEKAGKFLSKEPDPEGPRDMTAEIMRQMGIVTK